MSPVAADVSSVDSSSSPPWLDGIDPSPSATQMPSTLVPNPYKRTPCITAPVCIQFPTNFLFCRRPIRTADADDAATIIIPAPAQHLLKTEGQRLIISEDSSFKSTTSPPTMIRSRARLPQSAFSCPQGELTAALIHQMPAWGVVPSPGPFILHRT